MPTGQPSSSNSFLPSFVASPFGRLLTSLLLTQGVLAGVGIQRSRDENDFSSRRLSDDPSVKYGSYNSSMLIDDVYTQLLYGNEGASAGFSMEPFGDDGLITSGYHYPLGTDTRGQVYGYFGGNAAKNLQMNGTNANTFLIDNDDGGSIDDFGLSLKQITINDNPDCVMIAAHISSEYAPGSGKVSIFCDVSTDTQQLSSADPFAEFYGPTDASFGICLDSDDNYVYVGDADDNNILHRFSIPTSGVFTVVTAASGYCAITDSTATNFASEITISNFDSGSGAQETLAILNADGQATLVIPGENFCSSGSEDISSTTNADVKYFSDAVSGVNFGDMDCDGVLDLIMENSANSAVTVIYGGQTLPNSIDEDSLEKSKIQAPIGGSLSGFGYATGADDIDGDGCDDLIIGAPSLRVNNQYYVGGFTVIKGPITSSMNIERDCDGYSCIWITGSEYGQQVGQSVLITENGTVFVGAPSVTVNGLSYSGAVYRIPITFSEPTNSPTPFPLVSPTPVPTSVPTPIPTNSPTSIPSTSPTPSPSFSPSQSPIGVPTNSPTSSSKSPTSSPSSSPSSVPTFSPSFPPTPGPSSFPTSVPTPVPTHLITPSPSVSQTSSPTPVPSVTPTSNPSVQPTLSPSPSSTSGSTASPTSSPSENPTPSPSSMDGGGSTSVPSQSPTPLSSTSVPTPMPTVSSSLNPTAQPTFSPTSPSSNFPTGSPSFSPTHLPSPGPTPAPTTGFVPLPTPPSNSTDSTEPFLSSVDAFSALVATGAFGFLGAAASLLFCFVRRNKEDQKAKAKVNGEIRYDDVELGKLDGDQRKIIPPSPGKLVFFTPQKPKGSPLTDRSDSDTSSNKSSPKSTTPPGDSDENSDDSSEGYSANKFKP